MEETKSAERDQTYALLAKSTLSSSLASLLVLLKNWLTMRAGATARGMLRPSPAMPAARNTFFTLKVSWNRPMARFLRHRRDAA